jgi:voltage-gated potassium channel
MFSSVFGIAIIALPSGVITAGYLSEINNDKETAEQTEEESQEKV